MARLAQLISGFADVLQVAEGSIRNVASVLRSKGLLTTGPRGPGAPHMTPQDATNLLLGIMYDDAKEAAHVSVPRLRDARLKACFGLVGLDYGAGSAGPLPPHPFLSGDGNALPLGDALDAMLDHLVRHGVLDGSDDDDDPKLWSRVANMSLSVERPGYAAVIWIDAISVHWTLRYEWDDPEAAARRAAEKERGEMPSHRLAHLGPFMSSMRQIRDEVLIGLGHVLRGREVDIDDPELDEEAPYDNGGARV